MWNKQIYNYVEQIDILKWNKLILAYMEQTHFILPIQY